MGQNGASDPYKLLTASVLKETKQPEVELYTAPIDLNRYELPVDTPCGLISMWLQRSHTQLYQPRNRTVPCPEEMEQQSLLKNRLF